MAIRKRVGKTGTRWLVDYYDSNGKRRFITCQSQREAKDKEAELRNRRAKGDIIIPSKMTFRELTEGWVERKGLKPSTARAWGSRLKHHILPQFGDISVQKISRGDIKNFLANLRAKDLAHETTKNALGIIRLILADAVDQNLILANPCAGVKVPRAARDHHVSANEDSLFSPFTEEETKRFVEKAMALYPPPSQHGTLFTLAVYSGLRRGELCGLTWQDLALGGKRPTLRVKRAWDRTAGFITPKSKAALREVPILPFALKILKEWQLACPDKKASARVFLMGPDSFSKPFRRVLRKADLPQIRFHDLRGTYASILARRNIPPKVLQRLMGHSNFSITMDIYAKFTRDDEDVLDRALVGFGGA